MRSEGDFEHDASDSSVSSASTAKSSISSRYVAQAKKRLKGADQDKHFEKRHGNMTYSGYGYSEASGSAASGSTAPPNAPSLSVTFLVPPNTPRPGTMQAHFPRTGGPIRLQCSHRHK